MMKTSFVLTVLTAGDSLARMCGRFEYDVIIVPKVVVLLCYCIVFLLLIHGLGFLQVYRVIRSFTVAGPDVCNTDSQSI